MRQSEGENKGKHPPIFLPSQEVNKISENFCQRFTWILAKLEEDQVVASGNASVDSALSLRKPLASKGEPLLPNVWEPGSLPLVFALLGKQAVP